MTDREARMQSFVDLRWGEYAAAGSSWIGFYLVSPDGTEMHLGPCRDAPACTPIGLHGMCGRAWRTGERLIIRDVRSHGDGHIVCDPRNLSEAVIPLFDQTGNCWGVFDADSHAPDHYTAADVERLTLDLRAASLTTARSESLPIRTL